MQPFESPDEPTIEIAPAMPIIKIDYTEEERKEAEKWERRIKSKADEEKQKQLKELIHEIPRNEIEGLF